MLRIAIAVIFCFVIPIAAYSSGSPPSKCGDMMPKHLASAQKSIVPFKFTAEPKKIRPGETVAVTLSAPEGKNFKGFLAAGRKADSEEIVGTFDDGVDLQTIDCFDISKTGITHTNGKGKTQINATWKPGDFKGKVKFWATFVESLRVFWVNVSTDEIEISGDAVPQVASAAESIPFQSVYDGCYDTKGCFGGPDNCVADKNCVHLVTYKAGQSGVEFEMFGKTRGWIAVGFSDDAYMGGDSVTGCTVNGSNDRINVFQSWNPPNEKNNVALANLQQDLTVGKTSYEDGYIYCKFNHEAQHTILNEYQFNLLNQSYFIFLARGLMESLTEPVKIQMHVQTYQSAVAADLTDTSEIGLASDLLIKLHGSLMIAAWIGTVSVAIFLARYYKQTWPMKKHCGEKIWFTWHRFLNIVTLALNVAGFVVIFVFIKGWSHVWEINPHPILGVIVTALVIIQPIMAIFRCHPGSSRRPIFNWLHFLVGNSAHILGVVTLFFARTLVKAKLPDFYMWVLIAFVGFHVAVFLIVEAFTYFHGRKDRVNQIAMKDMSPSNGNSFNLTEVSADVGNRFYKSILFIYVFGNILFVIALISIVCMSPVKER